MPIGFPAIPDPRSADLRGLQLAVRNIRERITAAEGVLLAVQAQANQSSFDIQEIAALARLLASLTARVTALEALTAGVQTVTLTAAAPIARDDPVVMVSPTECVSVDVSDPQRIYAVVGVATAAAGQAQSVVVRVLGAHTLLSGAFTAGRALYCGVEGITEDPAYGIVAIPIGVATGTQTMWVQPGYPRLQYPSVYDASEQFLPVTWGLARQAVEFAWEFAAAYPGLMVKHPDNVVITREVRGGLGISVLDGDGKDGDPTVSVDEATAFTWDNTHTWTQQVRKSGAITPAQITANQNDYNPTGMATAYRLRIESDAARDITGLQGGADGREVFITNVGAFAITLVDASGLSAAANRFAFGASLVLGANGSALLQYDGASARWRAA